ncbi:MAG: hypothetical protein ACLQDM_26200 [Bradyrhizobium sp.]
MPGLSQHVGGIHPPPASILRRRARELRVALVAHLLGLGAGAATAIGLTPAALALVRALT